MDESNLKSRLCRGVQAEVIDDEFKKTEKVLAPFLRTLKKRKRVKTDLIADEYKELYLKSNPAELLLRLQESYTDPLRLTTLLNETGELLKAVTKSKCFNLYTTDYDRGEIQLVSQYVTENDRFQQIYPIESGTYLACHVAYTKEYVMSKDIIGDGRFPEGIPNAGATVKAALCIPILTNNQGNCIGVIELYKDYSDPPYDLINLQICSALTAWLGIAIEQNSAKISFSKETDIHKQISELSNLYFSRTLSFEKVLSDIIKILKSTTNAERGAFYIFKETVPLGSEETIFAEAFEEGFGEESNTVLFKKRTQLRYMKDQPGIPGYVARTGEILTIRDAYKDSRFDRSNDSPLFRTRSILCAPIKTCHGSVGVVELINRFYYPYFRKEDIDMLTPHLSEVALICQHYELDSSNSKLQLKLVEGGRLLDVETKPYPEEIAVIRQFILGDPVYPLLYFKFDWDASSYEEDAIKIITMSVMNNDLLEPCFDLPSLIDFLLRVKRSYRPVAYHNFEHAFNVFHCFLLILMRSNGLFKSNEVVSLFIAALCHDIDHSGLTNSFMYLKNDPVAQLYEDNCGEIHRYEVTMFMIQATNVLMKFNSQNYQVISRLLKRLMIGFDLAVHFSVRKEILSLLNSNQFDWTYPEHRYLASNVILVCADNYAIFKQPDTVKKTAANFHKELQHQGDLERAMEFEPLPMMDRNKSETIPESQIVLMTVVSIPAVEIVARLFPSLAVLIDFANSTLEKWKEIVGSRGQEMWKMNVALVKERRDKKFHRVSVSRSSSIKTFVSER